jgi:uncharacterized membrane protein
MPPLQQPQQLTPKWISILVGIFALIGFSDATYLTIDHYLNIAPPCFVGSCEVVLTSAYSSVAHIPVSIFGVLYYFFVLVTIFLSINAKDPQKKARTFRAALFATPIGFLASLYFFIIQAFVLHHFCQYCLLSATTSTALFIIALCWWLKTSKK